MVVQSATHSPICPQAIASQLQLIQECWTALFATQVLAKKMTVLYRLAREQLSKQHHYDFGLRALKSVLVMAGALKRGAPDMSEALVLMRALRDSNLPKFVYDDVPLFLGLVGDLFPGECCHTTLPALLPQHHTHHQPPLNSMRPSSDAPAGSKSIVLCCRQHAMSVVYHTTPHMTGCSCACVARTHTGMDCPRVRYPSFNDAVEAGLAAAGYQVLTGAGDQVDKVVQLYEVLMTRHTVMIVGQTGGGKSVIVNTLAHAQTAMGRRTVLSVLNPKAITVPELYGVLDKDTRDWTDGLLSNLFRYGYTQPLLHETAVHQTAAAARNTQHLQARLTCCLIACKQLGHLPDWGRHSRTEIV